MLRVAGVVRGGAPLTALVLVLAPVDAGREGVLAEVVAVRGRGGRGGRARRGQLAAVLPVRARRVLGGRRARAAPARAPLRRRRADLPHELPDRVPDRGADRLARRRLPPAAVREPRLLVLLALVAVAAARRRAVALRAAAVARRRVVRRRLGGALLARVPRAARVVVARGAPVAAVVAVLVGEPLLEEALALGRHGPVLVLDGGLAERAVRLERPEGRAARRAVHRGRGHVGGVVARRRRRVAARGRRGLALVRALLARVRRRGRRLRHPGLGGAPLRPVGYALEVATGAVRGGGRSLVGRRRRFGLAQDPIAVHGRRRRRGRFPVVALVLVRFVLVECGLRAARYLLGNGVVRGARLAAEVVLEPLGGFLFARLLLDIEVGGPLVVLVVFCKQRRA